VQERFDGSTKSAWLLHSSAAARQLQSDPGNFTGAARVASQQFLSTDWLGTETMKLSLEFAMYSEQSRMFTLTEIGLDVGEFGHATASVKSIAHLFEPYPHLAGYVLDVVFVLLLVYIMKKELAEMWLMGRHGRSMQYWTPWNVIDWVSIVLGVVICGLWIYCCLAMRAGALEQIMDMGGMRLRSHIMDLEEAHLDQMMESLGKLRTGVTVLHAVVAVNTISIILRFFKAFAANGRLNVVATTFASSYEDIVHFLIVFLIMYLCMAVIAHILFGADVREFRTVSDSLNTVGIVVMGEFDWYVALSDSPNLLPSGMPRTLVVIWFFSYMFFVSIVLINMLLAIILERYSVVSRENMAQDKRTLWSQSVRWLKRIRETKGFLPLANIRTALGNQRQPAHPEDIVTSESLKNAFKGLQDEQAAWLMEWLSQEAFLKETTVQTSVPMKRLQRTQRLLRQVDGELKMINPKLESCTARLNHLDDQLCCLEVDPNAPPNPQQVPPAEVAQEEILGKEVVKVPPRTKTVSVWRRTSPSTRL